MRHIFRWHSLRTSIILWLFIPTVIILIAVAAFIFNSYDEVTEDLVIERNRDLARLSSSQLMTQMNEYEDRLVAETRKTPIYEGIPTDQQGALEQAGNRLSVFDAGVIILDTYGTVVAAEPERPEIMGRDWSDRGYYRDLVVHTSGAAASAPVFSDIVTDGPDGTQVIVAAVRIEDPDGKVKGVMAGMFRMGATSLSSFYGDLVKLHLGETGAAYLVDGEGRVIYHTDTDLITIDFSAQDVVRQVIAGQAGGIRTRDYQGRSVVASYAPVAGTSWGLVTEESWNSVTSSGRGYRNILILLLALGVAIPAVIASFAVRRITRPIAMVSEAAKEIAGGNFDQEITIDTGDELEEMADQFNLMAGALKESYANLEQKVEERTEGERRRAEQLRAVNEVGRRISSILDLDQLLSYVVQSLQETFSYYNVGIILIDRNSGALVLKASAGAYEGGPDIGPDAMETRGIVSTVAGSGEPVLSNDLVNDPIYGHIEAMGDTRAEMAVPIIVGGKTVGVLDIEANQVEAFDELDLFTAQTLADQLAIAIENARLYEQAHDMATMEERQRLARDLHDAVTQTLFSASLIAEVLPRLWEKDPEEGKKRLEELRRSTRGALAEMRILLLELRPAALTEVSLADLLRQMTDAMTGRSGIPVGLTVEGQGTLPADVQIVFYRIAQEALNNIQKHAEATVVSVELSYRTDSVELRITDNGIGFDPGGVSAEHLGLNIIYERAESVNAVCTITSETGRGTQVIVKWQIPR